MTLSKSWRSSQPACGHSIRLHQQLHNVGTVRAHFLGIAVNVYGRRVWLSGRRLEPPEVQTTYNFAAYYHTTPGDPVLSLAYVTTLGDSSSTPDTELDPGDILETDHIFYVPRGRFDLLTVQVDAVSTKFENATIPTHLVKTPRGASTVVTSDPVRTITYNTNPLTSLNLGR